MIALATAFSLLYQTTLNLYALSRSAGLKNQNNYDYSYNYIYKILLRDMGSSLRDMEKTIYVKYRILTLQKVSHFNVLVDVSNTVGYLSFLTENVLSIPAHTSFLRTPDSPKCDH